VDRRRLVLATSGGLATSLMMLLLGSTWAPPDRDEDSGLGGGVPAPALSAGAREQGTALPAADDCAVEPACGVPVERPAEEAVVSRAGNRST